ncbi:MAG: DNA alkylation repair protein [Coriobacteriia bacterium]|nr:DNA alkylation repair protein [Coriobacteriia bacterium]
MSGTYKNLFNAASLREFGADFQSVYPEFPVDAFVASTMGDGWDDLELKGRWQQVTNILASYLPEDYAEALAILDQVVENYSGWDGVYGMVFPYFVESFGQDAANWDLSMTAMANYTQHASAEFAVRPFIISNEDRMMAQMYTWSKHDNEHVRRLASEGSRPALPWAQALPAFKQDPTPVLPILEQLKDDPSAYVRKSVANNLNDISKTHPELVIDIARNWQGESDHTDWIIKHACRTLLKRGNRDALALFGFHDGATLNVTEFYLGNPATSGVTASATRSDSAQQPAIQEQEAPSIGQDLPTIAMGGDLSFSFAVHTKESTKLRLEYGIDFVKASGKASRKVFQISETELGADEIKTHTKKHNFKDLSTRKHYPGTHSITLIVNGVERGTLDFELQAETDS